MNKLQKVFLMVSILIIGGTLAACSGSNDDRDLYEKIMEEGKIVVGTMGTYAPFSYHDDNGLTGFDVEIAREVAHRLGVEIEFVETRWDGLLAGVNTSRYDMVANQVWRNAEREATFTLTDQYMLSAPVLVVRDDNDDIRTLDDITGKKGGHSLTSVYADMTRSHGGTVVGVDTFTEGVQNIINGHIDYTINNIGSVSFYMEQNPNDPILAFPLEIEEQFEVVFTLPKENANTLLVRINEIIAEMKADGTYDVIYQQFIHID